MESYIFQLYFGAAFDRVSHSGLLFKLKYIGVCGCVLSICREFLSNCRGRESWLISEWIPIFSGVPQGSVLGPFLFILYTSEMFELVGEQNIYLFSQSLSIFLRYGVCCWMSSSASRVPGVFGGQAIPWSDFPVVVLYCLCCTRLVRTQINVCSMIFHLLFSELNTRAAAHLLEFEVQGVECPNLQGVSFCQRYVCEITFPTLCLALEC